VNLDGIVYDEDVWEVVYRQGDYTGECYPVEIGGHPKWDPRADIVFPAQIISGDEIFLVHVYYGQTWGPPY